MRQFDGVGLMVLGHGNPQTRPFCIVENTRRYVESLREAMQALVENEMSLLDATEQTEFETGRTHGCMILTSAPTPALSIARWKRRFFNEQPVGERMHIPGEHISRIPL